VIEFAYATGGRIASEVLPLEWRQVYFEAGEIRLDVGTTKNNEGRTFPMTADLRRLLEAQDASTTASSRRATSCRMSFSRSGRGSRRKEEAEFRPGRRRGAGRDDVLGAQDTVGLRALQHPSVVF
jgi:integrase